LKASGESQFNIHPMDQFIIQPILSSSEGLEWYTFTNQSLWMLISLVAIGILFVFGIRKNEVIPGRLQSVAEVLYTFVKKNGC
jgi:F-type H+-transporting ATPase subunit a